MQNAAIGFKRAGVNPVFADPSGGVSLKEVGRLNCMSRSLALTVELRVNVAQKNCPAVWGIRATLAKCAATNLQSRR
jgi:hypothetical protein